MALWTRTTRHTTAHHGPRRFLRCSTRTGAGEGVANAGADRRRRLRAALAGLSRSRTRDENHILRAYLMGYMTCFGFAGGGLCC